MHFANDIRDSLTLGLLVVVGLSRNSALTQQAYVRFRPIVLKKSELGAGEGWRWITL